MPDAVPDDVRMRAALNPGESIPIPDIAQVFIHGGVPHVLPRGIIGVWNVDDSGRVVAFHINLGYRLVVHA